MAITLLSLFHLVPQGNKRDRFGRSRFLPKHLHKTGNIAISFQYRLLHRRKLSFCKQDAPRNLTGAPMCVQNVGFMFYKMPIMANSILLLVPICNNEYFLFVCFYLNLYSY